MSRSWRRNAPAVIVGVIVLVFLFEIPELRSNFRVDDAKEAAVTKPTISIHHDPTKASLVPGELPGYTGWARPEFTLAPAFRIHSSSGSDVSVGETWVLILECNCHLYEDDPIKLEFCQQQSGSLFFVRAYGPAVIVGQSITESTTTTTPSYRIQLLPMDPGIYTVEVVLTYSNPPNWDQFPRSPQQIEPSYEGYLLPGFPLSLTVHDHDYLPTSENNIRESKTQICSTAQLVETSWMSAWERYRWVVITKANHPTHTQKTTMGTVTRDGYAWSHNSLGVTMSYLPREDCRLFDSPIINATTTKNPLTKYCTKKGNRLHIIFVGDSNMRLQEAMMEKYYGNDMIRTSVIELYGGTLRCRKKANPNVTAVFESMASKDDDEKQVVVFNTGMHDIHRLCSQEYLNDRMEYLGSFATDADHAFQCTEAYKVALEWLAKQVLAFPADLHIFQTTTAGWPKYGNYGVVWPASYPQTMPQATEFIHEFNRIAYDVLQTKFPNLKIMDAYWLSVARPDNREVAEHEKKVLAKKLSHPGNEVVMAILQVFTTIVVNELCS